MIEEILKKCKVIFYRFDKTQNVITHNGGGSSQIVAEMIKIVNELNENDIKYEIDNDSQIIIKS